MFIFSILGFWREPSDANPFANPYPHKPKALAVAADWPCRVAGGRRGRALLTGRGRHPSPPPNVASLRAKTSREEARGGGRMGLRVLPVIRPYVMPLARLRFCLHSSEGPTRSMAVADQIHRVITADKEGYGFLEYHHVSQIHIPSSAL